MANSNIAQIKLTIKAEKKTYFSSTNINPQSSDSDLVELAEAINSLQNAVLDNVIKTVDYLLLPSA